MDADPVLARLPAGDLFRASRWGDITRLALGQVPHPRPVDAGGPRAMRVVRVNAEQRLVAIPEGSPWNTPGAIVFEEAIEIPLRVPTAITSFAISLDNNDVYLMEYWHEGAFRHLAQLGPSTRVGMVRYAVALAVPTPPTDRLRISALEGDHKYSAGHLELR